MRVGRIPGLQAQKNTQQEEDAGRQCQRQFFNQGRRHSGRTLNAQTELTMTPVKGKS
jgi:hypothetical protein